MTVGRLIMTITNDSAGPTNFAQVGLNVGAPGPSVAKQAAQLFGFARAGWPIAGLSRVQGIDFRATGAAGAVPVPFPIIEWAQIVSDNPGLPPESAYGSAFGAGDLTPAGTSINVMEYTAVPGRRTTGRMYLPYVSNTVVSAQGTLVGSEITALGTSYRNWLLGAGGFIGLDDLQPQVISRVALTAATIITPAPQPALATLRSRKR